MWIQVTYASYPIFLSTILIIAMTAVCWWAFTYTREGFIPQMYVPFPTLSPSSTNSPGTAPFAHAAPRLPSSRTSLMRVYNGEIVSFSFPLISISLRKSNANYWKQWAWVRSSAMRDLRVMNRRKLYLLSCMRGDRRWNDYMSIKGRSIWL